MRFHLWPEPYAIARLQGVPDAAALRQGTAPLCLVVSPAEISLLAPEAVIDGLGPLVETAARDWRAVSLDAVLPLDAVGVLASIARALTDVSVPVLTFSSHDTDHFLVPGTLLGRALSALKHAGPGTAAGSR